MMKKKKRNAKEFFLRAESLVAIVIVVLFVTASIVRPETFPTVKNIFNICRTFAIYAIMGVGMAMIIITTGIDLSVGATAAFTVCLGAWVNKAVVESIFGEGAIAKVQGGPNGLPGPYNILLPLLMIVVVIVAGALIGLCNGLMVSKVKIPAFIATLGMSVILLSSELPEVLTMCDRIMVMHHGELRGVLHHDEADQVKLMSLTLESAAVREEEEVVA